MLRVTRYQVQGYTPIGAVVEGAKGVLGIECIKP